jgi:Zn-dependent protease
MIIPGLICITFHEVAHGYAAYRLGDDTAKQMGRLTLNPIKHIDPFGLLMIILFRFGWAKPVPVNMMNFKHPRRFMAITAFAGPLANLIFAVVFMFIFGLLFTALGGGANVMALTQVARNLGADAPFVVGLLTAMSFSSYEVVLEILFRTVQLSIALAVFNLIPIPPLDGSKVLLSVLPDETYFKLMRVERFGMIILMVILFTDPQTGIFSRTIGFATITLLESLQGVFALAFNLVN